jgi:hypothetical protein
MSNSTCCTKLNPNIFFCVGEQSEQKISNSSCFSKSNPNVLFIGKQSEPNSNILFCRQALLAKKFQIVQVYYCVGKQSEPKIRK